MSKKAALLAVILLLVISVLTGCAKNATNDMSPEYELHSKANDSSVFAGNASSYDEEYGSDRVKIQTSSNYEDNVDNYSNTEQTVRKEIKNGEIAVEVKDVEAAYPGIMEIVKSLGGYEFNKSFYTSNSHKNMELVIKLPPENLDEFQNRLTDFVGNGKITRINIRSQDITSQYYDTDSRLRTYIKSRDRLEELLDKAETIEDTLKVHNEITRMQTEIDSLQGQIKMWDKLVEMATLNLYIDEEDDPVRHTRTITWKFNTFNDILSAVKNGFITTVNTLYSIFTWIIIAIISISPILVIAAVVIWIIIRRHRKKKREQDIE